MLCQVPEVSSVAKMPSTDLKSVKPYRTQDEYLYAMKEDLAEWFNELYGGLSVTVDNFFEQLETGVILCQHANLVQSFILAAASSNISSCPESFSGIIFRSTAQPGTFQARDNVSIFISWCRKTLEIPDTLLFESEDLVLRKNERSVVLCILEVARRGAKFGMLVPQLVQFEVEIDEEIRQDEENLKTQTRTCISLYQPHIAQQTPTQQQSQPPQPQETPSKTKYQYRRPVIEVDMLSLDEMVRLILSRCKCENQYPMIRVSEGKYKYGDSLTPVFLRVLRRHVMVRTGGGWDTLESFLDRHDPCRCNSKEHRGSHAFRGQLEGSTPKSPRSYVGPNHKQRPSSARDTRETTRRRLNLSKGTVIDNLDLTVREESDVNPADDRERRSQTGCALESVESKESINIPYDQDSYDSREDLMTSPSKKLSRDGSFQNKQSNARPRSTTPSESSHRSSSPAESDGSGWSACPSIVSEPCLSLYQQKSQQRFIKPQQQQQQMQQRQPQQKQQPVQHQQQQQPSSRPSAATRPSSATHSSSGTRPSSVIRPSSATRPSSAKKTSLVPVFGTRQVDPVAKSFSKTKPNESNFSNGLSKERSGYHRKSLPFVFQTGDLSTFDGDDLNQSTDLTRSSSMQGFAQFSFASTPGKDVGTSQHSNKSRPSTATGVGSLRGSKSRSSSRDNILQKKSTNLNRRGSDCGMQTASLSTFKKPSSKSNQQLLKAAKRYERDVKTNGFSSFQPISSRKSTNQSMEGLSSTRKTVETTPRRTTKTPAKMSRSRESLLDDPHQKQSRTRKSLGDLTETSNYRSDKSRYRHETESQQDDRDQFALITTSLQKMSRDIEENPDIQLPSVKANPRKDDRTGSKTRIPLPVDTDGRYRQFDPGCHFSLKRFDSGVDITNDVENQWPPKYSLDGATGGVPMTSVLTQEPTDNAGANDEFY